MFFFFFIKYGNTFLCMKMHLKFERFNILMWQVALNIYYVVCERRIDFTKSWHFAHCGPVSFVVENSNKNLFENVGKRIRFISET